ncbi:MAG: VTT domain-containing protein [Bifidobacteriaceae bacterium]|jgi:membrane protein DedA with SNARE-associated domain|nr:VTT domain-containing protein [Bifidobacteriaceae bacterium]
MRRGVGLALVLGCGLVVGALGAAEPALAASALEAPAQTAAPAAVIQASLGDIWRSVNEHIVALAGSTWALVAVYFISAIDGFFPPVPAETLVIATAAVYQQSGALWQVAVLWLLAAAGALSGDSVAYVLGRLFNATQWRIFAKGKGRSAIELTQRTFARGAAPLLMVGRFIPVGRVAVNLTAGTIRYPYRRFLLIDSVAALFWSAYAVGIGYLAGHATGDNPLLGVVVGVAFSATVGSLAQWAINRHYGKQTATDSADGQAQPSQRS